jgi:hypothetical protein
MDLEASNRLFQDPRYGKYLTLKTNKSGYSFTLKKKSFKAPTAGPSTYQEPPAPGEYDTFNIKHRVLQVDSSVRRHGPNSAGSPGI